MNDLLYDFKIEKLCSTEIKKINFPFLIQLLKYCKEVDNPKTLCISPYKKEVIAKNLNWSLKTHGNRFSQELQKLRKQNIIVISKNSHTYGSTTYEFNPEFVELKSETQEQELPIQQRSSRDEKRERRQEILSYIGQMVVDDWLDGEFVILDIEGINSAIKRFSNSAEIRGCKGEKRSYMEIYRSVNEFRKRQYNA